MTLGDVDGDLLPEIAMGIRDHVAVLNAKDGEALFELATAPSDSEAGYGWSLARLGDINGDGTPDFAFSEVETGLIQGIVHAVSGKDGRFVWSTKEYPEDQYRLGYELAALGDINADGTNDLIAGTWGAKAGKPGRAVVLSGRTGTSLFEFQRNGDDIFVQSRSIDEPVKTR
jgi:hypothetical protein